jgi:hypothetical protein
VRAAYHTDLHELTRTYTARGIWAGLWAFLPVSARLVAPADTVGASRPFSRTPSVGGCAGGSAVAPAGPGTGAASVGGGTGRRLATVVTAGG